MQADITDDSGYQVAQYGELWKLDLSEYCVQHDTSARSVRRSALRAGIACSGLRPA